MNNKRLTETFTCEQCGSTFHPFRASTKQFCSNRCKFRAKEVTHDYTCAGCGTPFFSKKRDKKYCSHSCYTNHKVSRSIRELLYGQIVVGDGCWEWQGNRNKLGYGRLMVRGRSHLAHRLIYELEVGKIPANTVVRHFVCDNPPCCNPHHLRIGSKADNSRDAVGKSRHAHGQTSYAKLTEAQAIAIIADPRKHADIAAEYNVSRRTVGHVKTGSTWKHLSR